MNVPDWISKELFQTALGSHFKNKDIEILEYTSKEAVSVGENYTSDLYRTRIVYRSGSNGNKEQISVIVKCSPESKPSTLQFVSEIKLFEKEIEMFRDTLPKLHNVLGEDWSLSSKYIYSTETPYKLIIFEDLSLLNFQNYDRQKGLDLDHCFLIINKMAKLHAASVILYEDNSHIFDNYGDGLYCRSEFMDKWIEASINALSKACAKWPGFEKYSSKIAALKATIADKVQEVSKRKKGEFNVLNHGDCWINNFMFSYSPQGKVKEFKFVDYQLVIYSSPVIDLHYFWSTSPKLDVRRKHLLTILDYYYLNLKNNLLKLEYPLEKILTKKQLWEHWNSKALYGFVGAMTVLPLVKAPNRSDASLDNLIKNEDENGFLHHIYNSELFKKHMQLILPYLDNLGIFD